MLETNLTEQYNSHDNNIDKNANTQDNNYIPRLAEKRAEVHHRGSPHSQAPYNLSSTHIPKSLFQTYLQGSSGIRVINLLFITGQRSSGRVREDDAQLNFHSSIT